MVKVFNRIQNLICEDKTVIFLCYKYDVNHFPCIPFLLFDKELDYCKIDICLFLTDSEGNI